MTRQTGKLLPLSSVYNVRDMGGYTGAEGKKVQWGKAYRSGDLNTLSDCDMEYLNDLGIRTFVDFRDDKERTHAPDRRPPCVENVHELPIQVGNLQTIKELLEKDPEQFLSHANRALVQDFSDVYRAFFAILMADESAPVLFHCSAGKDRAGFAAAMFLSALGVDRETVIADYLLSGKYIQGKYDRELQSYPALEPLFQTRREYLTAGLDTIDQDFGGIDNYLTEVLEVDLDKMRRLYLN